MELANESGIGVFIRTGLACGKLTERVLPHLEGIREKEVIKKLLALVDYDAGMLTSLALNFLYQNKGISSVLLGTKNVNHLKDNFELLEKNIDESVMNEAIMIACG